MKYEIVIYCEKCGEKTLHSYYFINDDSYIWMCSVCSYGEQQYYTKPEDRKPQMIVTQMTLF